MIKSLTFNQLLTYEGERFAQSFNITIERMLFFRWCQILVPKFWIGFQYWANVWNDSTICLWKTQQEVLDSPVLECRNWRSERPLLRVFSVNALTLAVRTRPQGWVAPDPGDSPARSPAQVKVKGSGPAEGEKMTACLFTRHTSIR